MRNYMRRSGWLQVVVLAGIFLVGCGKHEGPADAAVHRYLARSDLPNGPSLAGDSATVSRVPTAHRIRVTVVKASGLPDLDDGPGETDATGRCRWALLPLIISC